SVKFLCLARPSSHRTDSLAAGTAWMEIGGVRSELHRVGPHPLCDVVGKFFQLGRRSTAVCGRSLPFACESGCSVECVSETDEDGVNVLAATGKRRYDAAPGKKR